VAASRRVKRGGDFLTPFRTARSRSRAPECTPVWRYNRAIRVLPVCWLRCPTTFRPAGSDLSTWTSANHHGLLADRMHVACPLLLHTCSCFQSRRIGLSTCVRADDAGPPLNATAYLCCTPKSPSSSLDGCSRDWKRSVSRFCSGGRRRWCYNDGAVSNDMMSLLSCKAAVL
jgi:hypothetical protein